jgi:glycine cleavage system regulatory protein
MRTMMTTCQKVSASVLLPCSVIQSSGCRLITKRLATNAKPFLIAYLFRVMWDYMHTAKAVGNTVNNKSAAHVCTSHAIYVHLCTQTIMQTKALLMPV